MRGTKKESDLLRCKKTRNELKVRSRLILLFVFELGCVLEVPRLIWLDKAERALKQSHGDAEEMIEIKKW